MGERDPADEPTQGTDRVSERERRDHRERTATEDEVFAQLIDRVIRREPIDSTELLAPVVDGNTRNQLLRMIENYQHRSSPRADSLEKRGDEFWLGKFRVLGELGRGGMGIVYLAIDTSLNRKVALKVLPDELACDDRVVKRFLREAEAAARLRHPNIISIHLAGEVNGTYYYSMEYVPGITMSELLRALRAARFSDRGTLSVRRFDEEGGQILRLMHKPLKDGEDKKTTRLQRKEIGHKVVSFDQNNYVREAIGLIAQVADALEYAHSEGIVHRDIKPSNIILAPDGRFMLADFGLAKMGGAQSITRTGEFMGSPSYISPEQAMTRRVPLDHRTDIWSLGVSLYEFLTQEHPFESLTIELTLKNIVTHDPRPLRSLNPRLPKDVETIVQKMLEKNPDDRYHRAGEVAADLRCVLNYEAIHARSHGAITRGYRFVRRNRTRLVVGALSLALILVASVAIKISQDRDRQEVKRHFAWVLGQTLEDGPSLLDERAVKQIQAELWREWRRTDDLGRAIDLHVLEAINEIKVSLDRSDRPGVLRQAMRSLAKVHAIHMHNPNRMERVRDGKPDRAMAEVAIQLVWEVADRLRVPGIPIGATAAGVPERPGELWKWLSCFLGTQDLIPGIKEKDSLVRYNALAAMKTLGRYSNPFKGELTRLLEDTLTDLGSDQSGLDRVQKAAIDALVGIKEMESDEVAYDMIAAIIRSGQRRPGFLVRHRIVQVLSESPLRDRYEGVFEQLSRDKDRAVSRLAQTVLAEIRG